MTDDPYDGFIVTESRMPDGRYIRYYEWPAGRPEEAATQVANVELADGTPGATPDRPDPARESDV